jgi:hypothetical protein
MSRIYNATDSAVAHQSTYQTSILTQQNEKIDTSNTTLSGIKSNQEGTIGSINNADIGSGGNFRRSAVYAYDSINDQARSLRCDANGRLECSVDALEVSADTINLNTDNLETLTTATNTKLDTVNTKLDTSNTNTQATTAELGSQTTLLTSVDNKLPSALNSDQLKVIDTGTQFSLGLIGSAQGTTNTLLTSLDSKANTRDGHLNNIVNQTSGLATESTVGDIDTKLGDRLPPTLTTGGNLKVSIEEGGSTATLSEQQAQTALLTTMDTDTGNIASNTSLTNSTLASIDSKITSGSDATLTEAHQVLCYGRDQSGGVDALNVDNNGHLKITLNDIESGITSSIKTTNDSITVGENDISAGTGCQQVLIYGKDAFSPFNLEPLRTSSNKLLVENSELVNLSPITSNGTTSKTNIAMLGTNDGTNYRTIKVNDDGVISTKDISKKVKDVSWMTTELIGANSFSTTFLDTEGYSSCMVYGEQLTGTNVVNNQLKIVGSNTSGGTYFHMGANLSAFAYVSGRNMLVENTPLLYNNHARYLKIYNDTGSSVSITLRAVLSDFHEYQ